MANNDVNGLLIVTDFHKCFPDAADLLALAMGTGHAVTNDYKEIHFASKTKAAGYGQSHAAVLHLTCSKALPVMF